MHRMGFRRLFSRRTFILGAIAGMTAGALAVTTATDAFAQSRDDVPMDKLMAAGPLDELALGPEDAKVVIVEYASMTCGHCATFHNNVFDDLKKKYIDTGKVRFIMREFPLDNLAAAASMLSRCTNDTDKAFKLTSVLFKKQRNWVVPGNPVPKLFDIAKQAGFTEESFNGCLQDQDLLTKIAQIKDKAVKEFKVNATPTFFINGERLKGRSDSIETFDKVLEPLLKSS